uniref:BTB domain-containing protein n=1 Tax=Araucaria cunninghamii TaxID=56994 RepID=A0A0D6QVU9_ARACU
MTLWAAAASDIDRPLLDEPENCAEFSETALGEFVVLRVGGQVFEATKQTLCADPESMLAAWVLRYRKGEENKEQEKSVMRIDRDGTRFRHVLNYLRNGTVCLEDVPSLREVAEEAEYFCLAGLQELCENKIHKIQEADEALWEKSLQALREQLRTSVESFEKIRMGCGGSGEVYAVLRGRRLGCRDGEERPPEFRLDVDF